MLGNAALMAGPGPTPPGAAALLATGKTVMFLAVGGKMAGMVAVAGTFKPGAAKAVTALKLAAAAVGIALGPGADVAVESAGMTLLSGDLAGILRGRKLAQATVTNIRRNLIFAFACNAIGIPVAAGALYPITGLLLSPMIAAAAMSLSSVSVITHPLRLCALEL